MFPGGPSVLADFVFVLEVIEESEELGYFLCLRIVFYIKELPFYMLDARQSQDAVEFTDANVAVA